MGATSAGPPTSTCTDSSHLEEQPSLFWVWHHNRAAILGTVPPVNSSSSSGRSSLSETVAPGVDGACGGSGGAGLSGCWFPSALHQLGEERPLQEHWGQDCFGVSCSAMNCERSLFFLHEIQQILEDMMVVFFSTQIEKCHPVYPVSQEL